MFFSLPNWLREKFNPYAWNPQSRLEIQKNSRRLELSISKDTLWWFKPALRVLHLRLWEIFLQTFHANNHNIKANTQRKTRKKKKKLKIPNNQELPAFFDFPFCVVFGLSCRLSLLSHTEFFFPILSWPLTVPIFLPRTDLFLPVPTFWGQVPSFGGFIPIFRLNFFPYFPYFPFAFSVLSVFSVCTFRFSLMIFRHGSQWQDVWTTIKDTPHERWGQGPGSVDPRFPAGLPFLVPEIPEFVAFRDAGHFFLQFSRAFPRVSSRTPEQIPETATAFSSFLRKFQSRNFQSSLESYNLAWNLKSSLKISIPTLTITHRKGPCCVARLNFQSRLKVTILDWNVQSSLEDINLRLVDWKFQSQSEIFNFSIRRKRDEGEGEREHRETDRFWDRETNWAQQTQFLEYNL